MHAGWGPEFEWSKAQIVEASKAAEGVSRSRAGALIPISTLCVHGARMHEVSSAFAVLGVHASQPHCECCWRCSLLCSWYAAQWT